MKQSLNESKSLAVLLGVIILLLLGAFYYYFISPKVDTKKQTEQAISQLQTDITTLEQNVAVLSALDSGYADNFELRKKLPAQRQLDNLLRSIHEVEVMSSSDIEKITFNHYDEEVAKAENLKSKEEAVTEETEQAEASPTEETEVVEAEKPVTPINLEALPTELKLMSLELEMWVLDEAHLMTFLKEIEAIERIVRIDGVDISSPRIPGEFELTKLNPNKQIFVKVQLTTFYAEDVAN